MKRSGFMLVLGVGMLAIVTSCGRMGAVPVKSEIAGGIIQTAIFPARLSGGFRVAPPLERYGPDDLWKKINGAADLFKSYGMRELLTGGFVRTKTNLPDQLM